MSDRQPRSAEVEIQTAQGEQYTGSGILRYRSHPAGGPPVLQLGVPDDALGFRPTGSGRYAIVVADDTVRQQYTAAGAWLERIGTTWWFILDSV